VDTHMAVHEGKRKRIIETNYKEWMPMQIIFIA
jgi:hypothetical protein